MDKTLREIKFRAWDKETGKVTDDLTPTDLMNGEFQQQFSKGAIELSLSTGLKDKNGDKEVYECDIIDSEGNVIGNKYETPALLKDSTNLLIQGFGTKDWLTTYQKAVERGCQDA